MKKLLIVGYYQLEDGFKACANQLQKDYEISFFPLLKYEHDLLDLVTDLSNLILTVDVVFLWYFNYFTQNWWRYDQFLSIKHIMPISTQLIAYSWDPLIVTSEINPIRLRLLSQCHLYLTGDHQEIKYLKQLGLNHVHYAPSGFDPSITYPIIDNLYQCDVSIICTNLYGDESKFPLEFVRLNRKKIVDLIYANRHNIKFHIYGPPSLQILYPECYQREISYIDCPKVFSNSRINLCIHAVSNHSQGQHLYFSERLPQILGCRGLLYCETEYHYLLEPNVNYILADPIDPITQIKQILSNYDNYINLRQRGYELAINHLTWKILFLKVKRLTS